jgi:hypothetical protein
MMGLLAADAVRGLLKPGLAPVLLPVRMLRVRSAGNSIGHRWT